MYMYVCYYTYMYVRSTSTYIHYCTYHGKTNSTPLSHLRIHTYLLRTVTSNNNNNIESFASLS